MSMQFCASQTRSNTSMFFGSVFLLTFLLPSISSAACIDFPRTLSEGSRGADVTALQRVLNQDPATLVAKSGPGSPGYEISIFGHATTLALKRFQGRYRSAILTPLGRKNANGIADSLTRKKLGELSCPLAETSSSKTAAKGGAVSIENPSTYQVRALDTIEISGSGLADNNTVYFGSTPVENIKFAAGSLSVTIPESSPLGVVKVYVKNKNGTSNAIELFIGRAGKSISGAGSSCIDITRTLKTGDSGNDVLLLQQFLNSDTRTRVTAEGTESSGQETSNYSSAVVNAVAKFQTLYSSDILVPAKLAAPTGITSLFTADKIREITCGSKKLTPEQKTAAAQAMVVPNYRSAAPYRNKPTATTTPVTDYAAYQKDFDARKAASDTTYSALTKKSNDYVDAINAVWSLPHLYTAKYSTSGTGGTLTLSGMNFTVAGNDIYLCGNLALSNVTSESDNSITYGVKTSINSACSISLRNANGSSNSIALGVGQAFDPAQFDALLASSTPSGTGSGTGF